MDPASDKKTKWYWTTGDERFLRENFEKMSTQRMADILQRKHSAVTMKMRRMGLVRKPSGHKGQFQLGHTKSKASELGSVIPVRRNGKTIKLIKTENGWVPYGRYVWESANGPVPPDMKIWFIDGDQMNCDISNLKVISNKEAMAFARKGKKKTQSSK